MGPALQAAYLMMEAIGGKLLLFQTSVPNVGVGKITQRDNPTLYNTDSEHRLRVPEDIFFKKFAAEASKAQISIDVFSFRCHSCPQKNHLRTRKIRETGCAYRLIKQSLRRFLLFLLLFSAFLCFFLKHFKDHFMPNSQVLPLCYTDTCMKHCKNPLDKQYNICARARGIV